MVIYFPFIILRYKTLMLQYLPWNGSELLKYCFFRVKKPRYLKPRKSRLLNTTIFNDHGILTLENMGQNSALNCRIIVL